MDTFWRSYIVKMLKQIVTFFHAKHVSESYVGIFPYRDCKSFSYNHIVIHVMSTKMHDAKYKEC